MTDTPFTPPHSAPLARTGTADLWVMAMICGYFLVQMAVRLLTGPTLELDEAEAFWYARSLALGYGPQPPLYFWLQWGAFQLLGEGILALAAVKAAIFSVTGIAVFRLGRRLGFDTVASLAGVLSLGLLPEILWESQRALTHSVLVLCLSTLALLAAHRVLLAGRRRDYALLGLVMGLGILSKYNFAFTIIGIVAALAMAPAWRARREGGRLMASLGLGFVVTLPLLAYLYLSPERALASVHKLAIHGGWSVLVPLSYLQASAMAVLSLFALPILVLLPLALWKRAGLGDLRLRFLRRCALGCLLALLAAGVLSGATAVQGRWLMPVLWPLAMALTLALAVRLGPAGRRNLILGLGALWLLAAAALPYANRVDPGYRNAQFAPLLAAIPAKAHVAVQSDWLRGNLILLNPQLTLTRVTQGQGADLYILDAKDPITLRAEPPLAHVQVMHGRTAEDLLLAGGLK